MPTLDPDTPSPSAAQPLTPQAALDGWDQLKRQMALLLRNAKPDAAWLAQLVETMGRMRSLAQRDTDIALYAMLQAAASEADNYSANHAILCALVCEVCAESFDWPPEERRTLVGAALTMNLAMSALQDALAQQRGPLTGPQREQIDAHAEAGASLLAAAGLADACWIEVVRQHHAATADTVSDSPPTAEQRLAQLLHRVDIYTAKLSRRASREPASPALAARDACLDAAGLPDAIGATMLRILGLYPPGCYVMLASGDTGIVICRGAKAHTPVVAALRRADGALYNPPVRRDTSLSGQSVLHGVTPGAVKVSLHHLRTLSAK